MSVSVTPAWLRIEAWLREHAPRTFASLPQPAAPEAIAEAEAVLGLSFPRALVESLLRHDGSGAGTLLPTWWALHAVRGLTDDWQQRMRINRDDGAAWDPEREYGPWWHAQWIPIAWDGSGNSMVIDQRDCTKQGRIGIADHEVGTHFEPVGWMASLPALLTSVAVGLEERMWAGGYVPRGSDDGELEWVEESTAEEEDEPPRYGKFGRLLP
ncbi:SMI1/KNR4 family protein [Streptomyces sp. A7024]|uniref:SMI1/KNR4 family protein n=1 Tax=Streptomyces coryli TaxID=1128680 RepID=A0A6G4U8A4_9ACTN|nr:SMI1/KNR4 family protein [Streptomyces coryli]NGN67618.1 SMI1/KNR4 family protein [Streptomyces coryli]